MKKIDLHWQILIAMVLAVICGRITGTEMSVLGVTFFQIYEFTGTLFLNALRLIIVPLVMATIIHGVANLSGRAGFGRLGGLTFAYFAVTTLVATTIGMLFGGILTPGMVDATPAGGVLGLDLSGGETGPAAASTEADGSGAVVDVLLSMVPTNVVAAAADGQLLSLIVFSLLFGYFMGRIPQHPRDVLMGLWHGISETMMLITGWIMRFAPYGIFGIVAGTAATTGFSALAPLMSFIYVYIFALAAYVLVVQPLLLKFIGGVSPYRHLKAVAPALLTAFSTASSSATLPVTFKCVEERVGVSEETASVVLPLGATVNMDGVGVYNGVAALFLAQAYGIEITIGVVTTVFLLCALLSVAAPGLPGIPFSMPIVSAQLGLPLEGAALLFTIDRFPDMLRTAVNVYGDTCAAVVIARVQGEQGALVPGQDASQERRIIGRENPE